MKISLFVILLFCYSHIVNAQSPDFQYVSPKPSSILVSNGTNIIIQSSTLIDRSSLLSQRFLVTGAQSGKHSGNVVLSDDGRTIVFNPDRPFSGSEVVTVVVRNGIKNALGTHLPEYSFHFTTMPLAEQPDLTTAAASMADAEAAAADLPAPSIKIDSVNNPSDGFIFLATWDRNVPLHKYANYLFLLDKNGSIVDSMRVNGAPFDFRVQPNGRLSYGLGDYAGITPENSNLKHYVLDSSFTVVDSFQMKNGYLTDFHDFIHLPNGHAMLMSYHTVTMDMSLIAPGGRPDALVVINIFQEQDADKNVVFEWRDIDYIPITDTDLKLTDPRINPSTLNAFELDNDGNLLFSFRNHSDIMKISRETGEIMWRWGGLKNEFTFVGEHQENAPYYFSRQHNILRRSNGNVTLYDNGEFHTPPYSRAAEYQLDEVNKVATLVSEYRYAQGNIFTQAAGNANRLDNGGWFVGYGILSPTSPVKRNIVETHNDGTVAFELSLPANVSAYRVSKHPWRQLVNRIQVSNPEVLQGNTYSFNKDGKTTGVSIKYVQLTGDSYNNVSITRIPYGPVKPEFISSAPVIAPVSLMYSGASIVSHTSQIHAELKSFPEIKNPAMTSMYIREFYGQGLFVELPTVFDSTANELIASTTKFGEIVFGVPDVHQPLPAPLLIEPVNSKRVSSKKPVNLKWSGRGIVQLFRLQVATDSAFASILLDTTTINSYVLRSYTAGQKYYWRVRSTGTNGPGEWSAVWNFLPADLFVKVTSPNGGEKMKTGTPVIVRWDTNISDSVKINLRRGVTAATLIGRSYGANNAYLWNISAGLTPDSAYRMTVVSYLDSTLADTSDAVFTLTNISGIASSTSRIPDHFGLSQNYPNPFNPSTVIRYALPSAQFVSLNLYDLLGKEIARLVNEEQNAGEYTLSLSTNEYDLSSGVYFYKLSAGAFTKVRRMIVLK